MVERVWSARTESADRATAYAAYFRRVVLPELAGVHGYLGARLLQRDLRGGVEVVVCTRWESLDVIRGFAGGDIDHAVVHDEAAALFSDYDHTVRHFEIVSEDR
jgi:heme-degrading monooxygenase HmoA